MQTKNRCDPTPGHTGGPDETVLGTQGLVADPTRLTNTLLAADGAIEGRPQPSLDLRVAQPRVSSSPQGCAFAHRRTRCSRHVSRHPADTHDTGPFDDLTERACDLGPCLVAGAGSNLDLRTPPGAMRELWVPLRAGFATNKRPRLKSGAVPRGVTRPLRRRLRRRLVDTTAPFPSRAQSGGVPWRDHQDERRSTGASRPRRTSVC